MTLPDSVTNIGDMFVSVSFCGDFNVNGGQNVFRCVEGGFKPTQCFNDWLFERVDGK